jgi:hypothetical protein
MKIKSINCEHTVKDGEIAVNLDEEINQKIVDKLQDRYKKVDWIQVDKVQNEKSVLEIKINKHPLYKDVPIVAIKDIEDINNDLSIIKKALEEEENSRKNMLKNVSRNAGLPLDCEE